ncbi:hypothetical protein [Crossiella sp. CA198]|uniref:hypothetical protein n=1 Tax=Crossiella sp. CA198 TaxID=3455607 RepID=UPI003F8D428F
MVVSTRLPTTILGGGYLMVGVLGLNAPGNTLLGVFTADLAHSWLHLALGAILLVGGTAGGRCGTGAQLLSGALAGVAGTLGLALTGSGPFLATTADNILHLSTAMLLLVLGLSTAVRTPPARPGRYGPLSVASYCGR